MLLKEMLNYMRNCTTFTRMSRVFQPTSVFHVAINATILKGKRIGSRMIDPFPTG